MQAEEFIVNFNLSEINKYICGEMWVKKYSMITNRSVSERMNYDYGQFKNKWIIYPKIVVHFLQDFVNAVKPVSFVLHSNTLFEDLGRCHIQNEQTGEELIIDHHSHGGYSYFLVRRFTKGDDQGWRKIMEEKETLFSENQSITTISMRLVGLNYSR